MERKKDKYLTDGDIVRIVETYSDMLLRIALNRVKSLPAAEDIGEPDEEPKVGFEEDGFCFDDRDEAEKDIDASKGGHHERTTQTLSGEGRHKRNTGH